MLGDIFRLFVLFCKILIKSTIWFVIISTIIFMILIFTNTFEDNIRSELLTKFQVFKENKFAKGTASDPYYNVFKESFKKEICLELTLAECDSHPRCTRTANMRACTYKSDANDAIKEEKESHREHYPGFYDTFCDQISLTDCPTTNYSFCILNQENCSYNTDRRSQTALGPTPNPTLNPTPNPTPNPTLSPIS